LNEGAGLRSFEQNLRFAFVDLFAAGQMVLTVRAGAGEGRPYDGLAPRGSRNI